MLEVNQQPGDPAVPFDFRQSEQIPDSQLEPLRKLHEGFVRGLCASLTVSLRCDVTGNVAGVEQSSSGEFVANLAAPSCLVYFTMQPYEGTALIEVNQSLLAPILDCVLGGTGRIDFGMDREITDIEQVMLDEFFRTLAFELREAWKPVAPIAFEFDRVETNPQMISQRFPRNESVVLVVSDLHVGEKEGQVIFAIPAITFKLLRQKLEPPAVRKSGSSELGGAIQEKLAAGLKLELDCALVGSSISLRDLMALKVGDVIDSGVACDGAATILVNGIAKFRGEVTVEGAKQAVIIHSAAEAPGAAAR